MIRLTAEGDGPKPVGGDYGRGWRPGVIVKPVLVLKLTSASAPNSNSGVYGGYSEGGPNISQPWLGTDGNTYYTAYIADGWLVDIRFDTFASSNWRRGPTTGETRVAFSLNPATPRILYYIDSGNDKTIHATTPRRMRMPIRDFPVHLQCAVSVYWLQLNLNDDWIVGMLSNATVIGVRLSDRTGADNPQSSHDVDEPPLIASSRRLNLHERRAESHRQPGYGRSCS